MVLTTIVFDEIADENLPAPELESSTTSYDEDPGLYYLDGDGCKVFVLSEDDTEQSGLGSDPSFKPSACQTAGVSPRTGNAKKTHFVLTSDLETIFEQDEEEEASPDIFYDHELPELGSVKWTRAHTRSFYPSADGLGVFPLLWRPAELLANCNELYVGRGTTLRGKRRLRKFSAEPWPSNLPKNHVLGCHEKDALRAERIRSFYAEQKDDNGKPTKESRRFFRRLGTLEFQRAVFDALVLPYQILARQGHPCTVRDRHFIRQMKRQIIRQPVKVAKDLKRWAGVARSHWFEDKTVPLPEFLQRRPKWFYAVFSFVGRGLPPPPYDPEEMPAYIGRLCSEPPPEPPNWRPFVRKYLSTFRPTGNVNYRTDPGVGASLGVQRIQGGFTHAVQTLVSFGACLDIARRRGIETDFDVPWDIIGERATGTSANDTFQFVIRPRESFSDIGKWHVPDEARFSYALRIAVHAILRKVSHIPLMPINAPEKGLKCRYPSMTLAAATLLYQIFRRAVDSHLTKDPTCSSGLGGPIPRPYLGRRCREGTVFYSQDLSCATDFHPFWLTRTIYEEILPYHPRLKEWEPYFGKLFGPHQVLLVSSKDCPPCPVDDVRVTDIDFKLARDSQLARIGGDFLRSEFWHGGRKLAYAGPLEAEEAGAMSRLVSGMSQWLEDLACLPSRFTTTSCSMGDATSFPGMPILTSYACEQAGVKKFVTTGDDAVLKGVSPSTIETFEKAVQSCGGLLSVGDPVKGKPNKIFKHSEKFCFCEELWNRGRRVKAQHLSLWIAPPGGSKGHIDWFNQAESVRQHLTDLGLPLRSGLWTQTATFNYVLAAFRLGVPVGAPVTYGGINHPALPPRAGLSNWTNWSWNATLSQLTQFQLASGTGLSPLPTGVSGVARQAISSLLQELKAGNAPPVHSLRLGGEPCFSGVRVVPTSAGWMRNPTVEEGIDNLMSMVTSWESYHRETPSELKTPRVALVAAKLGRRIRRVTRHLRNREFTYDETRRDISRKMNMFIDHRVDLVPRMWDRRSYGLLPTSLAQDRQRQATQNWEHLTGFRVDRAYLNPKVSDIKDPKSWIEEDEAAPTA